MNIGCVNSFIINLFLSHCDIRLCCLSQSISTSTPTLAVKPSDVKKIFLKRHHFFTIRHNYIVCENTVCGLELTFFKHKEVRHALLCSMKMIARAQS